MPESPDEPADEPRERAQPVDDHPRAADEQDDRDNVGRFDEATRQRDDGRERTDRRGINWTIGTGHDDTAAGRFVVAPMVLTCGKRPRHERRNRDAAEKKDQRMG